MKKFAPWQFSTMREQTFKAKKSQVFRSSGFLKIIISFGYLRFGHWVSHLLTFRVWTLRVYVQTERVERCLFGYSGLVKKSDLLDIQDWIMNYHLEVHDWTVNARIKEPFWNAKNCLIHHDDQNSEKREQNWFLFSDDVKLPTDTKLWIEKPLFSSSKGKKLISMPKCTELQCPTGVFWESSGIISQKRRPELSQGPEGHSHCTGTASIQRWDQVACVHLVVL